MPGVDGVEFVRSRQRGALLPASPRYTQPTLLARILTTPKQVSRPEVGAPGARSQSLGGGVYGPGVGAGVVWSALLADGGRQDLPAGVRWAVAGLRQGGAGVPVRCGRGPDGPRHAPHALRPIPRLRHHVRENTVRDPPGFIGRGVHGLVAS